MNRMLLAFALSGWNTVAFADEPTQAMPGSNDVVAVTMLDDGKTNTWTVADLQAALGLLNRKYHREVRTLSGRHAWHGALKRQIIDRENESKTEIYEDGTAFVFPYEEKDSPSSISNRNAQMMRTLTNGVPVGLAKVRMRRVEEKATTNVVNVVTGPGAEK